MGTRVRIEELVAQATTKFPDTNARLDALEKAGPPVLVALMILADDMDVLRQRLDALGTTKDSVGSDDLSAQLSKLSSQLNKMSKAVTKLLKKRKKR